MNIKTIKNLIVLGSLAFVVFAANSAHAYVPGVWDPSPRVNPNESAFFEVPNPTTETSTTTSTPTTTTTTSPTTAPKTVTVARATTTKRTVVASNTYPGNYVYTNPQFTNQQLPPAQTIDQPQPVYNGAPSNDLTALSMAGSGSFMPSSVWQWFLVILLILAIIIIVRSLTRAPAHQTHTISAH